MSQYNILCDCGGKSSTMPGAKKAHKMTIRHQKWAEENSSKICQTLTERKYKYICDCGSKLMTVAKKNMEQHNKSEKHQKFINNGSKNEPVLN